MKTLEEEMADLQQVIKFCLKSEAAPRLNAMIDLTRSEPGIPVMPDDLDRDPWLLNCENGTLNLRTGTLRPHRREDMLTKLCPTRYDADARCPLWEGFLWGVFGKDDELIDYLQRLLGHCLTGDVSEHVLPIFWGDGANGKSTLLGAVEFVLGDDYAMAAPPDLLLARRGEHHPTERADLFGKRLVVCQETGQGRRLNEALVKELTGGDRLKARRMREDFWEFSPTHKLILVTNHKPEVQGSDTGIWRRLRLIPFARTFSEEEQDKALPAKLQAEAPGILAWMVRGCLDWQRLGMKAPEKVFLATEEYREEEDVLGAFLTECCRLGDDLTCRASVLYARFHKWQEESGEHNILKQKSFGTLMTKRGFERYPNAGMWYRGLATAST